MEIWIPRWGSVCSLAWTRSRHWWYSWKIFLKVNFERNQQIMRWQKGIQNFSAYKELCKQTTQKSRSVLPDCTGESFQDYSWIQDFWGWLSTESQAQNPELCRFLWLLWFNFSLSKDDWPFKLEIVDICRHTACFKIWFSKVQDFGNFNIKADQGGV